MAARRLAITSALAVLCSAVSFSSQATFDAAASYQLRCATCHGDRGQGTRNWGVPPTGPALKGNPFVANGSPAAIAQVIRKGRQGARRLYDDAYPNMPAFDVGMVPDVDALVAYLKGDLQK